MSAFKFPLANGGYTLVDWDVVDYISDFLWYGSHTGKRRYIVARGASLHKGLSLHREVMGLSHNDGKIVDHINGDTYDNRRCNLRVVTPKENSFNTCKRRTHGGNKPSSKYKGVCFDRRCGKWMTYVGSKFLGYEEHEEKAALLYNMAAQINYGEHAKLNEVLL